MNNGGCSHICLVKPQGRTCNCPTGISLKVCILSTITLYAFRSFGYRINNNYYLYLQADRKVCASAPTNFLVFSHRIDIRFVSLDTPYLIDVVLPLPPIKHALGLDFDKSSGNLFKNIVWSYILNRLDQ